MYRKVRGAARRENGSSADAGRTRAGEEDARDIGTGGAPIIRSAPHEGSKL